jgi:hypothetical protein
MQSSKCFHPEKDGCCQKLYVCQEMCLAVKDIRRKYNQDRIGGHAEKPKSRHSQRNKAVIALSSN